MPSAAAPPAAAPPELPALLPPTNSLFSLDDFPDDFEDDDGRENIEDLVAA